MKRLLFYSLFASFFGLSLMTCIGVKTIAKSAKKAVLVQENEIQLSVPSIQSASIFFEKNTAVEMVFLQENAAIHYTLDGTEPTLQSPIFKNPILLQQSTQVKAKVFQEQFLPSETVSTEYIQLGPKWPIKSISLNQNPNENYRSSGTAALVDRQKGSLDFQDGHWLGFNQGTLEIDIVLEQAQSVKKVVVSLLSASKAWIFPPESVSIYALDKADNKELLHQQVLKISTENSPSELIFVHLDFPVRNIQRIKIVIKPLTEIPDWHPGKGQAPWLFMDEILIK